MNIRTIYNRISKPAMVSAVSVLALALFATAGSLTPPGVPASTMRTLAEIYDSIAGTFSSGSITANQNGSLMENLKYIEANMFALSSDSLDFDEFVNNMTLDADTTIASAGFTFSFMGNVGIGTTTATESLTIGGGTILVNQTNPVQVASFSDGQTINYLQLDGNYAYVLNATLDALQVYDITEPASPALIGSVSASAGSLGFAVGGGYLYVLDGAFPADLKVYDVTSPQSPNLVGVLPDVEYISHMVLSGKYLYAARHYKGYSIYDVSDPSHPRLVSNVPVTGISISSALQGNYLYFVEYNTNRMHVVDISNPASTSNIATVPVGISAPHGIVTEGRYAYLSGGTELKIYDISNPASPSGVAVISRPGFGYMPAVSGRYLYTPFLGGEVRTYDISTVAAPLQVGSVSIGHSTTEYSMSVARGGYLFTGLGGFRVFQIAGLNTQGITGGTFTFGSGRITENLDLGGLAVRGGVSVGGGLGVYGHSSFYASGSAQPVLNLVQGRAIGGPILDAYASASRIFSVQASGSGDASILLQSVGRGLDSRFVIRSNGTADQLNILNGVSANLVTIASTGNVGIGTTTPTAPLDVYQGISVTTTFAGGLDMVTYPTGNAYFRAPIINLRRYNGTAVAPTAVLGGNYLGSIEFEGYDGSGVTNSDALILALAAGNWSATSHPTTLTFWTTPTNRVGQIQRMTIIANGNVGIGTDTPVTKFAVVGSAGNYDILNVASSSGTSFLRITKGGNVGIGTTTPSSKLTISQGDIFISPAFPGQNSLKFNTQTFSTTTFSGFSATIPRYGITYLASSSEGSYGAYLSAYNGFRFYTGNTNTVADRLAMVITNAGISPNTGNVGIGDASPEQKLTVGGNILASTSGNVDLILKSTTATGDEGRFRIRSAGASDELQILSDTLTQVRISSTSYTMTSSAGPNSVVQMKIGSTTTGGIIFGPSNTNAAAIFSRSDGSFPGLNLESNGAVRLWANGVSNTDVLTSTFSEDDTVTGLGKVTGLYTIQGPLNREIRIRGGDANDAGDGVRIQTAIDVNENYLDRIVVQAFAQSPDIYFTNFGNFGIGDTTPDARTEIVASGSGSIFMVSSTAAADGDRFIVTAGGNVGIGTTTPSALLHVSSVSDGDIFKLTDSTGTCAFNPDAASFTIICSSDSRLKTNIIDAPSALDYLAGFRIRQYTVNASGKTAVGVIAQELLETHPELVSIGSDGMFMVTQPSIWQLVKGIQELSSRSLSIEELLSSNPLPETDGSLLARLMHNILAYLADVMGIELTQGRVKTDTLCLGDACITEPELRAILRERGSAPVPTPVPSPVEASPTPTVSPSETVVEPLPSPTPDTTPTPEITPDAIPTPEPTPATPEPPTAP